MLFHLSIAANDPCHVAGVVAELWNGEALPFPPVIDGCWIALAGGDRGSASEVDPAGYSATHAAIATSLDRETVLSIAAREGWPAKYRKRGNIFGVIELWIEGQQMIEVMTPEMQAEYIGGITIPNWKAMLAAGAPL